MFSLPRFGLQTITSLKRLIRIEYKGEPLPIIFIEDKEKAVWEIPTHPVDSNIYISDTVWSTPAQLSLTGYVSTRDYKNLMQKINTIISSGDTFTVYYLGGVYKDMMFSSISKDGNSDNVTSYKLSIEMTQILKVAPILTKITLEQAKVLQDSDTIQLGQSSTKDVSSNKSLAARLADNINLGDMISGIFGG